MDTTFLHARENAHLEALGTVGIADGKKASLTSLLRRPEVSYSTLTQLAERLDSTNVAPEVLPRAVTEQVEIQVKYEGYIVRQGTQVDNAVKLEHVAIPDDVNYEAVRSLSHEGREKLGKIRPRSLGQASRIPGLRPGDIQILSIHLETRRRQARHEAV